MINKRAINSPYALAVHVHTQYHDGVITGDQARSAIADGLAEQIGMDPVSVRPFIARRWEASPKSLGGYRNLLRNRDSFAGWVRAMKAALVGDVRAEKPAGLFVVLLVLALVAGCTAARATRPAVKCTGVEALEADLPSRVIYEQTGFAVAPYVVLAPPADGVFPELGCAHLRSGEIRGRHFRVCVDAFPYWEEIHPWTRRQRTRPYQAGDTIYAWYWGAENPFH